MKEKIITHNLKKTLKSVMADDACDLEHVNHLKNDFFSWNQGLVHGNKALLPNIGNIEYEIDDCLILNRAALDLACCYLLHHNQELGQDLLQSSAQIKVHNGFEKARVIIHGVSQYRGFARNIAHKISDNLRYVDEKQLLPLILLDLYFPNFLEHDDKIYLEDFRSKLDPKIISLIHNLLKYINDQHLFFKETAKIVELLQEIEEEQNNEKERSQEKENQINSNQLPQQLESKTADSNQEQDNKTQQEKSRDDINSDSQKADLKNSTKFSQGSSKKSADDKAKNNNTDLRFANSAFKSLPDSDKIEFIEPYNIYSTKFDEVVLPHKLVTRPEMAKLKEQLDERSQKLSKISPVQISNFKKKLIAKKDEFLDVGSIEGIINRKKLSQLIANPQVSNILINKRLHRANNVAVTILLDNSGSMRGKPITISALACHTLAKILEQFSIKTEIIGFTTGDWKGGRVRKLWEEQGKKPNPGRLNELRHIIYKDFQQSFKRSQSNLALMLKEGLLKENIDGEAILFAAKRLEKRQEQRKIMLVISDGNPIDDATNSVNKNDFLINHLENVVRNVEKRSKIEIAAIKIGYSNNNFYKNSVSIKLVEEVGDVMLSKVAEIL